MIPHPPTEIVLATKSRPMTKDIYDLFYVIRFLDSAILGDYEQFNARYVNRTSQN